MTDAETTNVEVTYREAEPQKMEVETRRREGDFAYYTTYKFNMTGSIAELTAIVPDGEQYNVLSNAETRAAAKETVENLPFVQGVVMIE
jgi:hypothetical protein